MVLKLTKEHVILFINICSQSLDKLLIICVLVFIFTCFDTFSGTPTPPTLFPLVQCQPGSGDKITVGCFARDFYPKSLTFQWTDDSGTTLTSENYPPAEKNNKYTGVSLVKVSISDWDSRKSFNCSVNHNGSPTNLQVQKPPPKVTLLSVPSEDTQTLVCTIEGGNGTLDSFKWKKNDAELNNYIQSPIQRTGGLYSAVSVLKVNNAEWDSNAVYTCEVTYRETQYKKKASKGSSTVTLNQPSAKGIFNNKQAELECIITGQDKTFLNTIQVTWQIDGLDVTSNINESPVKSVGVQHSKTSTMTRSLSEWQRVNKVRCSAIKDDMTPVIQDLTVHKGDGSEPKVTVYALPEEDISKGAEVSLVCLVSGPVMQDYYIAWSEGSGNKAGIYMDGINFPPQKTQQGYLVTSVYTTTKEKWDKHNMFYCNVWPAGRSVSVKPKGVSKAQAPVTVTLNQPSAKGIFNNKQAELECVITGQDETIVNEIQVTWQIDGQNVTNNIAESTSSSGVQHSKTSMITRSLSEWQRVNKVRCSAIRDDMTPVIQDLTVHKGDGSEPNVTVHVLPEEDISNGAEVSLVCLVSGPVLQDYYIAWSEGTENKAGIYMDGINFPPQKIQQGYLVTSIYTTTKEKWDKHNMFYCNVWPAGRSVSVKPKGVSKAQAPVTVTLNQPSAKGIFNNKQAELECIITGQDKTFLNTIQITWQIDGLDVTSNINESPVKSVGVQHSKTSTMTRSLSEWQRVNKVRCSAIKDDMTPVIQDLTVHKGDGSEPKVTVYALPEEDISKGAEVSLVCLVSGPVMQDYYIAWSEGSGNKAGIYMDGINFPPQKTQQGYLVTSVYTTTKEKWDKHNMFYCNVWPAGRSVSVKPKGVSKAQAPVTVTLNQPSAKGIFNNKQAELECIITGQDETIVNEIQVTWQIDGQDVTNNIAESTSSSGVQHSKTSTITRSLSEWQRVNKVRCSAIRDDMTPVIQDLTVHKGDGSEPNMTVHVLPEEDISNGAEVSLVCLVSGPVMQDYYIAWSEGTENKAGIYMDGINFPPQKTQQGYLVTSIYTTTKEKWDKHNMFYCNVWPAGRSVSVKPKGVSKAQAPVTVTLNQPSAKGIFNNKQAELECIITGQDKTFLNTIQITWQIDGLDVTNNINESPVKSVGVLHSKTSTMTRSLSEWQRVNKVRCSAIKDDMTPVIQDLTVHKGDGSEPKVTVYALPEEDISKGAVVSLVCLVSGPVMQDYYIAWSEGSGNKAGIYMDGINFPPQKIQQGYLVTSVYTTTKEKWDKHNMFYCNVWPAGRSVSVKPKGVSKAQAPVTVTLNQPSAKEIFSNNKIKLECIITGQDETIVNEIQVTWQIDGQNVTNNINESTVKSVGVQHSKTSTMTRSLSEWQRVNKVSCSAIRDDMTPVIQDLTVHKGDGSEPNVTVHALPEEDISKGAVVSLVCLVSGPVLQDYYIAWSEGTENKTSNYKDGINFPPQKTQQGYLVTSVYTTTKEKWGNHSMFNCIVWPAGRNKSMDPKAVSKAHDTPSESKQSWGLSCIEDAIEEDEFSSLWSTTSSFIFLFISSLFYSMIFSLVKMKTR
ncbi:uncharacterized protein LOC119917722 [Micropterus salmoides]|uniref:uncharacterized protein LOC119917722 n=1 Tax=Micropterus salmoides TaxID=27706 RepID=UPI0018EC2BAB|nr:uncharacterized protein LOC119917722 [Micropterus salmoides]